MMEKVRRVSKKYYLRQIVACWLVSCMFFNTSVVFASMNAGNIVVDNYTAGVSFDNNVANTTTVTAPHQAIIEYNHFNVDELKTLHFDQANVTDAVLNRIIQANPSSILGNLTADGRVFIVNPAGIIFGDGARINVSQLVASSLGMTNEAFQNAASDITSKMVFTDGADAGNVQIQGTLDATNTGSLYFVGKNVINTGNIICPDGLVVMAAGDSVQLGQPGSDVIVKIADLVADTDNIINNQGTVMGDGDNPVDKLVLAAGDVWSQAISNVRKVKIAAVSEAHLDGDIYAYAEGASDAISEIDIEVGGDFTANHQIIAEAEASTGFNSRATVTIDAGGELHVKDLVKAEADAEEGAGNATATVDINADEYVLIYLGDEGEDVQADVWVVDSGDGTATVNITSANYVDINGFIKAEAEGDNSGNMSATVDIKSTIENLGEGVWVYENAEVLANAKAENGSGNATADVLIEATGGLVDVSDSVTAEADAESGSGDATATINITTTYGNVNTYDDVRAEADTRDGSGNAVSKAEINAGGDVEIDARFKARSEAVDSGNATADTKIAGQNIVINSGNPSTTIITRAITNGNTVNTGDAVGNTVIAARENVTVNGNIKNKVSSNDAGNASSDIKISGVDIDINSKVISRAQAGFHFTDNNYYDEDGNSGNATAGVDIAASGIVNVNDVVKSNAEAENNSGSADATTKIVGTEVNITYGESSTDRHGNAVDQSVVAFASTYDNSGNATADVEIEATNGNVDIDTDGYPVLAKASVENPDTEYDGDATAGVKITADEDVKIYDLVKADADADDENGTGDATATVDIIAGSDVKVIADGSTTGITADASGGTNNTANIIITANVDDSADGDDEIDADVKVIAVNGGTATIEAKAEYADNKNDADVTINADDDVKVIAKDGGNAKIKAESRYSFNNSADVDITAGDTVKVKAEGGSEASIKAKAYNEGEYIHFFEMPEGENKSTTSGIMNTANVDITATTVKVTADGAEAKVEAFAGNEIGIYGVRGDLPPALTLRNVDNNADVTITTLVEDTSGEENGGTEPDEDAGDVLITSKNGGKAIVVAKARNKITDSSGSTVYFTLDGLDNNAKVTLDAAEDVEVSYDSSGGQAVVKAVAENEINDFTDTTLYLTMDGLIANTAGIDIFAGGNVLVDADYGNALIEAKAKNKIFTHVEPELTPNSLAQNSAGVNIDADGDVTVSSKYGKAKILASAENAINNTARVKINAGGNVLVEGIGESEDEPDAEIRAESQVALKSNNSDVTINANNVDVIAGRFLEAGFQSGSAQIAADAQEVFGNNSSNTANVKINANGALRVQSLGEGSNAEILALAANTDLYVAHLGVLEGLVNTAKVDVTAKSVEVRSMESASAIIAAEASNEIYLGGGEDTKLVEITFKDIKNDADIIITTAADDDGDPYIDYTVDNGDVLAIDINGGENSGGGIDTEAYNDIYSYDTFQDIDLTIQGPVLNTSNVLINAGDDVSVVAINGGDTEIDSEAWNEVGGDYVWSINLIEEGPVTNTAGTNITAGDDVEVTSSLGSWTAIGAWASNNSPVLPEIFPDTKDNIATVNINAGGYVSVHSYKSGGDDYGAEIIAGAEFATNNTATVTIGADERVNVTAYNDSAITPGSNTAVKAVTDKAVNSNTSDVEINARYVSVVATNNCNAEIEAEARNAYGEDSKNSAGVEIYTHAAAIEPGEKPDQFNGDVGILTSGNGEASIGATTENANTNTSDVLFCTDGDILVYGHNGNADIFANAQNAYSNTANIGIGAKGDEGVLVRAEDGGTSFIKSWAQFGHQNTAETIVCTQGGVQVLDLGLGLPAKTAGIIANALFGDITDAYVGVCAVDDVMVSAGMDPYDIDSMPTMGMGGHAMIRAEAARWGSSEQDQQMTTLSVGNGDSLPQEPTFANADVVVVSKEGGVGVIDFTGEGVGTAEITASAHDAEENTANVGVIANGDLFNEEHPSYEKSEGTGVAVAASGPDSLARILAEAYNGQQNTADTVVATPGEVLVNAVGDSSRAQIKSKAGWWNDEESTNTASTRIYAGEVDVRIPSLRQGNGIWAYAAGLNMDDSDVRVRPPHVPYTGDQTGYDPDPDDKGVLEFILTEYVGDYGDSEVVWTEENSETGTSAALIIKGYSESTNLPDCPGCPCEEKRIIPPIPPAPIGALAPIPGFQEVLFEEGGCPGLMVWLADEVGVGVDVQVFVANAFAYSTDCQPCEIAARLKNAAAILSDEDGSRMAAMNQVFSELAPDAPFTPEMAASIVTAFAGRANDGTQYATAIEYIDAFVQYVAILNSEMGSPVSDPVAYVMEKYGSGLTESENSNIAAFIAARIESGETFAQ